MFSLKHARAPTTADELWEQIDSEFMAIDGHCTILHLQTKQEAKARSWKTELDDFGSENAGLARFRKGDTQEFLASSRAGAKKARPTVQKWVAFVLLGLTRLFTTGVWVCTPFVIRLFPMTQSSS
jgi:hypothetical protein